MRTPSRAAFATGWAVDAEGNDTRDPELVAALYPFGEHKGSGLGLMADVFSALLSDSPYGPDIPRMYGDMQEKRRLGGLVGVLSIESFTDPTRFRERAGEMIRRLGRLPPTPGADRVLFPGEPELLMRKQRLAHGIPLGRQLFNDLNELATTRGLARLETREPDGFIHE